MTTFSHNEVRVHAADDKAVKLQQRWCGKQITCSERLEVKVKRNVSEKPEPRGAVCLPLPRDNVDQKIKGEREL